MIDFNGRLLFAATDDTVGNAVWISDGSASTTKSVSGIRAATQSASPDTVTEVGSGVFLTATTSLSGRELWYSDGTESGTALVKDIQPGPDSSGPNQLTNVGGTLFFSAYDESSGTELWKSDGTKAGTVRVRNIRPGTPGASPVHLTNVNGTLYFTASDGVNGRELWKSNGTEAGTVLVRDIRVGSESSSASNLTNVDGTLFFTANDGVNGTELWTSDGTAGGTVLVRDIRPGSPSSSPQQLINLNGSLLFSANDGTNGKELWKSDGSSAGTTLVRDINSGSGWSDPDFLTNVNGTLYFSAYAGVSGNELWKSDGTLAGTTLVADIRSGASSSQPEHLTNVNGTLFFTAHDGVTGEEVWKSDGTAAGTSLVHEIRPGTAWADIRGLTTGNGMLYFVADDGVHDDELWASDGTTAGTAAVTNADSQRGHMEPIAVYTGLNRVWMTFNSDDYGTELFEVFPTSDYGDADSESLHQENGARHQPVGIRLGRVRDVESDATATSDASGDDLIDTDDEDGVTVSPMVRGQSTSLTLDIQNSSGPGFVDAWMDFNRDGNWDDAGEQILFSESVVNGTPTFSIGVPATAEPGPAALRVRVSESGGLTPYGLVLTGEVEDHMVTIMQDVTVSLPSGNGSDSYRVRKVGSDIEVRNTATNDFTRHPQQSLNSLTVVGADNENDTLLIDLKNGGFFGLPGGIHWSGGENGVDVASIIPPTTAMARWYQADPASGPIQLTFTNSGTASVVSVDDVAQLAVSSLRKLDFEDEVRVAALTVNVTSTFPLQAGDFTTVSSGQIVSTAPLALASGDVIWISGTINAPVAGELGSHISAFQAATLGRSTSPDGFSTRGILDTGPNSVTLNDSNQAVLGSLTALGNASSPGTIKAANGLLVDFGNNVTGYGTLDTPDDVAKQLMVNGTISGNSASQPITLPGYIKGVGRLDNVSITGTYSPGFSPAIAYVGSVHYDAGSTTILEIGGRTPGSNGHDRVAHAGQATLGGQLELRLIDSFQPQAGDSFVLMTATSVSGRFDTINTPSLADGLTWKITTTGSTVTAEVVSDVPSGAPTITGPGSVTVSQRPTLTWTAVDGATEYEIWVKNQSTGTNPFHQTNVSETSYTPDFDFGIGRFNLWIRAKNSVGNGPWTPQYNFSIRTQASLNDPGRYQNTHRPTLTWDPLPGAVRYDLWINDRLGGTREYVRDRNVTGTSWTPAEDLPLGLYQAWMRGIAEDGTAGGWSTSILMYVMPAPTLTSGINPTFDRTPTFGWDALPGAVEYEVFVRNRNTGATTLYERNISDLSFTPAADLPDGPYRVWVVGVSDVNVRSFWTSPTDIYVGGRTDLLTPAGSTSDKTPTFSWRSVDGAEKYELWVDQVGGTRGLIHEQNLTTTSFTPATALTPGTYRVWVRAISTTNETSPWSIAVDFTITDADGSWSAHNDVLLATVSEPDHDAASAESFSSPIERDIPDVATPKTPPQPTEPSVASSKEDDPIDAAMAWWADRPV